MEVHSRLLVISFDVNLTNENMMSEDISLIIIYIIYCVLSILCFVIILIVVVFIIRAIIISILFQRVFCFSS